MVVNQMNERLERKEQGIVTCLEYFYLLLLKQIRASVFRPSRYVAFAKNTAEITCARDRSLEASMHA